MAKILRKKTTNKNNILEISEKLDGNLFLASIIDQNGIKYEDLEKYLNPKYEDMYDPFELPDMNFAVDRIIQAIENKEKILIYGDYDADGNTATAILHIFFKRIGIETEYIIPNRFKDGYGLNRDRIKEISDRKIDLVITVDCGITAYEEIEYAKELGNTDYIITDHHEPQEKIPDAIAVIDAKRKNSKYPFRELAGCGIAFKLVQAISQVLEIPEEKYIDLIEIAAIGTIADLVPLQDENRIISIIGLNRIKENGTKFIGLSYLLSDLKEIDSTNISFYLVPKINAAGRLGSNAGIKLLIEENKAKAFELKEELEKINNLRKEITEEITTEAMAIIEEEKQYDNPCIVVSKTDWNEGVTGIVAQKLAMEYSKPVIVLSIDKKRGIAKGSSRIDGDENLVELISKSKHLLLKYGGHEKAVGISIEVNNIESFKDELNNNFVKKEEQIILYNSNIPVSMANLENVKKFNILEPVGEGNEIPVFIFKNLKIENIRRYEKNSIIMFSQGNIINGKKEILNIEAIDFIEKEKEYKKNVGDFVNVLGKLNINNFREEKVQIQIVFKDF